MRACHTDRLQVLFVSEQWVLALWRKPANAGVKELHSLPCAVLLCMACDEYMG